MKRSTPKLAVILGVTISIFLSSCSKDDGPSSGENVLTFDGNAYTMVDGLVSDYGSGFPYSSDQSTAHYNLDFTVFDGEITLFEDGFSSVGVTLEVYVELFAPGESFSAGTFQYVDDDASASETENKHVFSAGEVIVVGSSSDNEYEVTGGSVVVSGSGNTNYTLTYNLQVEGGRTLTGTYAGSFKYEDERE
ncbi:hypothetical protein [Ekhidna sp.]|uniref:hypothetical protein n=1 Tax=Ekhidna sp. TaxID=2608089 RepID=UPI003CCC313D